MSARILKICSRGHKFYKSSDCPVCPVCWVGYYKNLKKTDIPKTAAPALRALLSKGIRKMSDLGKFTEKEVANLHGMGPKAMGILKQEMRKRKITFKQQKNEKKAGKKR